MFKKASLKKVIKYKVRWLIEIVNYVGGKKDDK